MINKIITDIEFLRQKSKPVLIEAEVNGIAKLLDIALFRNGSGLGLSAIQIGIPKQVSVIRYEDTFITLYNAEITEYSGDRVILEEGCLSIPGKYISVSRNRRITVKNGDGLNYVFKDIVARIVQHEIAHWRGELIIDYPII